ncbi:hypothetical protein V6Z11_A08G240700 [Gossypium hirsutum]
MQLLNEVLDLNTLAWGFQDLHVRNEKGLLLFSSPIIHCVT